MKQLEHSKSFFCTLFNFDEQNGNANPFCRHMISFLSTSLWDICFSVLQPLFPSPSEVHMMHSFSPGPRVNEVPQSSNSWNSSDTEIDKGCVKTASYLSILPLCLWNKQTKRTDRVFKMSEVNTQKETGLNFSSAFDCS